MRDSSFSFEMAAIYTPAESKPSEAFGVPDSGGPRLRGPGFSRFSAA
jgi:hypothetical protein